jgi:hypothetical protein
MHLLRCCGHTCAKNKPLKFKKQEGPHQPNLNRVLNPALVVFNKDFYTNLH